MIYNACSESDLESETNFQQPTNRTNRMSNNSGYFVRKNSLKTRNINNPKAMTDGTLPTTVRNIPAAGVVGGASCSMQSRRASVCSSFQNAGGSSDVDDIVNYGRHFAAMKRRSINEGLIDFRRNSNKSMQSNLSESMSSGSDSTCSIEDSTSTSSGQPNLPYPGFVEFSFKYLSQDSRPRNWCLKLITNP